jgi:hypothetical protein
MLGLIAGGLLWVVVPQLFTKTSTRPVVVTPSAPVSPLPTATEVFVLRSKCSELGDKIKDANLIGPALTQSVVSHYEPRTNRCYVQLTTQTANITAGLTYLNQGLYDGQTNQLLAFVSMEHDVRKGMVFVKTDISGDTGFDQASEFINKMMEDDRSR